MGDRVLVPLGEARELSERYLVRAGVAPAIAGGVVAPHLDAEQKNVRGQGLQHLIGIAELARRHASLRTNPSPFTAANNGVVSVMDGRGFFGQWVARQSADMAMEIARRNGAAIVGVNNVLDVFMLGHYVERIARSGLVGILMTQGRPRVHAPGGKVRVLGTNPIAIAIPTRGDPFLFDSATSAMSFNQIREHLARGLPLPGGMAIDSSGIATTDPSAALEGALSACGAGKGFGLSLAIALLCGAYVQAEEQEPIASDAPRTRAFLLIVLDPVAFGGAERILDGVEQLLYRVRAGGDAGAIHIPGERRFQAERRARESGLEIDVTLYAQLVGTAVL